MKAETLKRYLVVSGDLHDHWEAVVIGGRVAEGVHDGPHLLDPVQAGDWRTHHLPGRKWWGGIKHRVRTVTPTTFQLEAFAQSDEGSPGRQPMGGCRGLPVQEGDALQLDVDIIQALRAGNDRWHYQHARRRQTRTMTFAGRGPLSASVTLFRKHATFSGEILDFSPKLFGFGSLSSIVGQRFSKWGTRPPGGPPGGAREATEN